MLISEKITLFVAVWVVVMLFVTGDADIEIFIILIFIGLLIAKELTDRFTDVQLKHRMNIFICVFLMIFIAAVGKRIIGFLGV